jgi:predicted methyltransferase
MKSSEIHTPKRFPRLPRSLPLAFLLAGLLISFVPVAGIDTANATADPLAAAIASPSRTPTFTARDRYRHPLETLRFFGLRHGQTVVEIWPGSGWYMEILAPYLKADGKYYAGGNEDKKSVSELERKISSDPARFGRVTVTEFHPPEHTEICPPGTADLVLTFRNVHNWIEAGSAQAAFNAFFAALKPGGVLGVVEHRAKPGTPLEMMSRSGYVSEDYVKQLAAHAGFRFDASSPVNDNPKDTKDYPQGVWTLPPTLELGDKDRARYLAIGESDRMTLRFVKPKG